MKIRSIIIIISAAILLAPSLSFAQNRGYLNPKFTFNFPVKEGGVTFGFGGGMGYWLKPFLAVETNYLRIVAAGDEPANNLIEFNTIASRSMGKLNLLMQAGSGVYRITDYDLDTGWTGLLDFGIGIGLDFIPSLNLRLMFLYYSLFAHKDLFSIQTTILLSF